MSYIRIWIHAVWSTKGRKPTLVKGKRNLVFDHIMQNGQNKNLMIQNVNGHLDHVHCLFRLRNDLALKDIMQLIKGESSYFANKNKLLPEKLYWQKEFYAASVGESAVGRIHNYITKQEEHHKKISWKEEFDNFLKNHNFKTFNH